jgi:uncharacterized lipoprotein YmbA
MTATTDAERFPPLTDEQRERITAHRAALAAQLTAQPKTLTAVTTEIIYDLDGPVPFVGGPTDHVFTAVRVRVTRYPGATTGKVIVEGEYRRRNADGRPRANGELWHALPADLADALITRALTQS